jgi:ribosomal protein S6
VLHEITRVLAITDDVLRFMATNRIPGSSPARPDAPAEAPAEEVEAG